MIAAATDKSSMEKGQAKPQVLLSHHLKALRLPTFLSSYEKVAGECARDGVDHPRYLLRLAELELIEREGIHALTFRELGKQLGVSRSAAYRHFKDKEALLSAIYEAGANGLHGARPCLFCGRTSRPILSDSSGS